MTIIKTRTFLTPGTSIQENNTQQKQTVPGYSKRYLSMINTVGNQDSDYHLGPVDHVCKRLSSGKISVVETEDLRARESARGGGVGGWVGSTDGAEGKDKISPVGGGGKN